MRTSGSTYPDLASVGTLPDESLRSLVHAGDPAERVWAAWTLGLRLGRSARPDLAAAAHDDPTPGVRSLILVVLAGHGERSLVETFARDDPDAHVRAAAVRTLANMTSTADAEATRVLLDRLGSDESSTVRIELVRLALAGRIQPELALIERQLPDPDRYLRMAAIDLMTSRPDLGMTRALQARLVDEPDDEVWEQLARAWLLIGSHREFLAVLKAAEAPGRQDRGLAMVSSAGKAAPWGWLQPFSSRQSSVVRWLPRLIADATEPGARSWLLREASRRYDEIPPPTTREDAMANRTAYEVISGSLDRIRGTLSLLRGDQLELEDLRAATRLRSTMEEWLEQVRAEYLEEDGIDLDALPAAELPDDYLSWREGVVELLRIEAESDAR